MDSVRTKQCGRCNRELPLAAFWKRKRSKDGLQRWCQECLGERNRARYRTVDPKEWRAYQDAWIEKNREKTREYGRKTYRRDPTKQVARVMTWRKANAERLSIYEREWRRVNHKNTEYWQKRRATQNGVLTIPFTAAQLAAKFLYWGNRCWVCRTPASHVDHVKPLTKGGPHVLANLRPICGSCNSRKHNKWPWSPVPQQSVLMLN